MTQFTLHFNQSIIRSAHVQLNDALELEHTLYHNYDKIININKVLRDLRGLLESWIIPSKIICTIAIVTIDITLPGNIK